MPAIPQEQLDRISERAKDPNRRTYLAGIEAAAEPMDFEQLKEDVRRHGVPAAQGLVALADQLAGLFDELGGGAIAIGPGGPMRIGGEAPQELAPAPSDALIGAVEQRIGHALPEELRQLYAIGDGGFGPGKGLLPLLELGRRYLAIRDRPLGPMGMQWPELLLPLFDDEPVLLCLDLDSGAVAAWDPERIEDLESEGDWQRSFVPEYPSLAECMAAWLDGPTFDEHMPMPQ